jgi:hypothetical protein
MNLPKGLIVEEKVDRYLVLLTWASKQNLQLKQQIEIIYTS